ncbi:FliM/FliN family flagellar motor switch protein [Xanthomonas sp. NCPPB 3005]|uniref:FliM/FliN family flagellar motor switch protein n=1 Tax=Xanthomonas sp. NCPPB 3005 TaxID=3240913 RepID=UPI003517A9FE
MVDESNPVARDYEMFGHVKVTLVAEVGKAELTIDEVLSLKADNIVALNESSEAVVTLLLNGKALARGELLAVGDTLGVRILEIL